MSLRARLTILSTTVLVVALTTFTWITISRTEAALRERGDQELAALGSGLLGYAQNQVDRVEGGRPALQFRTLEKLQLDDALDGYAVVILDDGSSLPLPRLAREPTTLPQTPPDVRSRAGQGSFTVQGTDGIPYRARVIEVPATDAVLLVALTEESLHATTADLVQASLVTGGVLLIAFGLLTMVAVHIGLRPLRALAAGAHRIVADPTSPHLADTPPGTEVGDLTVALNTMLDSLRDAITTADDARLRTEQFADDAAHELRTPVTAIAGYAGLYRAGGIVDSDRLSQVFDRIDHEARRLGNLVEDLLTLNRLDHHNTGVAPSTDIVPLTASAAADSMAIDHRHPVTIDAPDHAWAFIEPDDYFRVVANLLANVRTHTPPGTETEITLAFGPDTTVVLTVDDDGPGIPPDMTDIVFDRFRRIAHDRYRDSSSNSGSGLGLAIVASLAGRAGGHASAGPAPTGGARFQVVLPTTGADGTAAR